MPPIGQSNCATGRKKVTKVASSWLASHPLRNVQPVCNSRMTQSWGSPPSGIKPSRLSNKPETWASSRKAGRCCRSWQANSGKYF